MITSLGNLRLFRQVSAFISTLISARASFEGVMSGNILPVLGFFLTSRVKRRKGEEVETTDARVLGKGDFVERVLREGARWSLHPMRQKEWRRRIGKIIEERCSERGVKVEEVRMGSRRGQIPGVRAEIVGELVRGELGVPLAEVARVVGVSTSAVSKILMRRYSNST
jgi:hypothetical protein